MATLARRRAALTAGNPRQIAVPLLGPMLLALVVAPALKVATGGLHSGIDYQSFVGVGTVGLVVPLTCIFAGLSVIVDRHSGAQRELLAAPIPRAYIVVGNVLVVIALAAFQVTVLLALSALRGAVVPRDGLRDGLVRRRDAAVHGVHVRRGRDARGADQ